ncbi:MAG: hypothetical protein OJF50_006439 [Nitrospira sp.]|jgi:hypothetical protein|nr:hypothetical protein [Nitrospira sp.]
MADSSVLNREIRQIEIALVSWVIAPPTRSYLTNTTLAIYGKNWLRKV